jgi:poly-gamma-glutamate synthesis protein (capsule biosynthesis protein)
MIPKRVLLIAFAVIALVAVLWLLATRVRAPQQETPAVPVTLRESGSSLTVAAVGDIATPRGIPASGADRAFDDVSAILQGATLAVGNLEGALAVPPRAPRWSAGTPALAADLRRIGLTIVSCANNHAADGGADAVASTLDAIRAAGLLSAGCGVDLDAARSAATIGTAPHRIALIAATMSASDEARATKTRGELKGRPGVNAVRFAPDVTADPVTYAALRQMAIETHQAQPNDTELRLSNRLIRPGATTSVELVADSNDVDALVSAVDDARAAADIVIVSLHSHEPGTLVEDAADFVRAIAHRAIDHGAALVIGHGPHRLRGIEIYKSGAIFYSLGNFAFEFSDLDPKSADVFDSETNLAERAIAGSTSFDPPKYSEPFWWQGVVATSTFEGGRLSRIRLDPIDLGTDRGADARGLPRRSPAERGDRILQYLANLSAPTRLSVQNGVGVIDLK